MGRERHGGQAEGEEDKNGEERREEERALRPHCATNLETYGGEDEAVLLRFCPSGSFFLLFDAMSALDTR